MPELTKQEQVKQLSALFSEAGKAHHQAYIETDGEDAEWALWYADYLQDRLAAVLGIEFTKSEIVYRLVSLSRKQPTVSPDEWWPDFYAMYFCEQYS